MTFVINLVVINPPTRRYLVVQMPRVEVVRHLHVVPHETQGHAEGGVVHRGTRRDGGSPRGGGRELVHLDPVVAAQVVPRGLDEAEAAKVKAAFRSLLVDEKIGAKRIDSICRVTDFTKMKLGKDGKLEGENEIRKSINEEWGEFKTTVTEKGAVVEKPLVTAKATKTKDEIFAISDKAERQKAIAENHELFGF